MPFLSPIPRTDVSISVICQLGSLGHPKGHAGLTSRASLQGGMGIGDGTARVVMEMGLDIGADDASEGPHELVHLARTGNTDCIRNPNTVHTNPVNGLVERQEIHEVGPEGILRREADLAALAGSEVSNRPFIGS